MKKVLGKVWSVIQFFIICYVIIVTIFMFSENKFGYTQIDRFTIININEEDAKVLDKFNAGDLMIIENTKDVKVGDVIFYYESQSKRYAIKYNKLTDVSSDRSLYTIGDSSMIIPRDRVIGTRTYKYMFIGKLFSLSETKKGFILFVILPIFIVFAYHLYKYLVLFFKNKGKEKKDEEIILEDEEIL